MPHSIERECDIIAEDIDGLVIIECKNILWKSYKRAHADHIKQKILEQKTIVDLLASKSTAHFELHSKKHVPQKWANWFEKNDITVVDP